MIISIRYWLWRLLDTPTNLGPLSTELSDVVQRLGNHVASLHSDVSSEE